MTYPKYDAERPIISFDTETCLFGSGDMAPEMICASFAWRDGSRIRTELMIHEDGCNELEALLARAINGELTIAGQNLPYDVAVVARRRPSLLPMFFDAYEAGAIHDTMNAEQLNDTAVGLLRVEWNEEKGEYTTKKSYSLENLARIHLGVDSWKDAEGDHWRLRYNELMDIPVRDYPEAASIYPQKDARYTLEIAELQREIAANINPHDPLVAMLAHVCRTYLALHLVSCWGDELDPGRVVELNRLIGKYCSSFIPELKASGLVVETLRGKNAGKLTKKKKVLQELIVHDALERGVFQATIDAVLADPASFLPEDMLTDGGTTGNRQIKTAADVLFDCEDKRIKGMARFVEAEKLRTAFAEPALKFNRGPIHSRYGWAETGRTTCSGGSKKRRSGFNVQQMPRGLPKALEAMMLAEVGEVIDFRSCLVPRPGWVMSSSDYSSLEMCTWSQACIWLVGYSALADALNEGLDPHSLFAANFFLNDTYENTLARVKAKDPEAKDARQRSKVGNFGMPGGMGAPRFQAYAKKQGVVMSLEECVHVKRSFPKQWPEAVDYFKLTGDAVGDGEATLIGLRSGLVRGGCGYSDWANGNFQELAAAGATDATWRIVRECYDARLNSDLYGSRMTKFVHDEFIAEHPIDRAHEAATRLADIARETMQEWVPDVKIRIEPALMNRWWKQAETVRDIHGRLQVWEPKKEDKAT